MKTKLIATTLLGLSLIFGTSCSIPDDDGVGSYRGPDEWENPIIAEIHRQHVYTGGEEGEASQVVVHAYRCASPAGETEDGPYACDPSCVKVDACIHAWCLARQNSWVVEFLFVCEVGDIPPNPIIRHEIGHFILRNSPEAWAHETGHPEYATVNGVEYRVKDIINEARWPAIARMLGLEVDDYWNEVYCLRDGTNESKFVTSAIIPEVN